MKFPKEDYQYVIIDRSKCRIPQPASVKRWVIGNDCWGMNEWNETIRELHLEHNFKRIIFGDEDAVLPALMMNSILGLGGYPYETFLAFRDKGIMCEKMARAGIPVPDFRVINCLLDMYSFASSNGYPFLIKPTLGAGGGGIQKIKDVEQLHEFCRKLPSTLPGGRNWNFLCQRLVNIDTTFAINGVVCGSEVRCCYPGRYDEVLRSFSVDGPFRHFTQGTLAMSHAMFNPLVDFAKKVAEAFAVGSDHPYVFHLEVLKDIDDNLFFCENACRVGGLCDKYYDAWSVNLGECSILGQLGIVSDELPANVSEQPKTDKVYTQIWFGIARGYSLHSMRIPNLTPFKYRQITPFYRALPYSPSTKGPMTIDSACIQVWQLESDPDQATAEFAQFRETLEKSCVVKKNV